MNTKTSPTIVAVVALAAVTHWSAMMCTSRTEAQDMPPPKPAAKTSSSAKPAAAPKKPAANGPSKQEREFWQSIKDSRNPEDFAEYLNRYPRGAYASLAERQMRQIEQTSRERALAEREEAQRRQSEQRAQQQRAMCESSCTNQQDTCRDECDMIQQRATSASYEAIGGGLGGMVAGFSGNADYAALQRQQQAVQQKNMAAQQLMQQAQSCFNRCDQMMDRCQHQCSYGGMQ